MKIYYVSPTTKEAVIKSLKKTEVLFLDFDETIVDYVSVQNIALQKFIEYYNIAEDKKKAIISDYEKINDTIWSQLEDGQKTVQQLRMERMQQLQILHPEFISSPEKLDIQYRDFFVENTTISEEVKEALILLKSSGIKQIIVSNGFMDTQTMRIEKIGIKNIIDGLITSEEAGKAKPDPTMLHQALKMVKKPKKSAWLIGDSLKSDIGAANNFGIHSCLISNNIILIENDLKNFPKPNIVMNKFTEFTQFFVDLLEN